MPGPAHLLTFIGVALALIALPGPSVVFVVSRGISLGRRAGLATAAGNESGLLVQVLAVAFGLSVPLERSAALLSVIKLAGALYLVFLGIQQFRHRKDLPAAVAAAAPRTKTTARIMSDGFFVGVTNPKGLLIFTAVLPQFISRGHGSVTLQLLILGLICVMIALVSDCAWGVLAGTAGRWFLRTPKALELIGAGSGVMLAGLGGYMALSGERL